MFARPHTKCCGCLPSTVHSSWTDVDLTFSKIYQNASQLTVHFEMAADWSTHNLSMYRCLSAPRTYPLNLIVKTTLAVHSNTIGRKCINSRSVRIMSHQWVYNTSHGSLTRLIESVKCFVIRIPRMCTEYITKRLYLPNYVLLAVSRFKCLVLVYIPRSLHMIARVCTFNVLNASLSLHFLPLQKTVRHLFLPSISSLFSLPYYFQKDMSLARWDELSLFANAKTFLSS